MPIVQAKNDARIFLDEDFTSNDVSEDFIGRKAVSLFKLKDMDVPVPPFIAVSGSIFTEYVAECLRSTITGKTSDDEIRKKILGGSLPLTARNEIMEGYSRLSGFADSWISVRSSAILPLSRRDLVFAGMLDTVLNVKGLDALMSAIKQVYASAFSAKAAGYLSEHNLSIADLKVGLVIQKMVQAEASGVVFTVDPISQNTDFLTIEAVYGLGDVIADGEITPDQYIIDKKTLEFVEKKIVPQDWMMVRKVKSKDGSDETEKVQISKSWQQQQKLENRFVKDLSKIALTVEKKAGEPQDLEWVFEGGRIWLLQTAKVQTVSIRPSVEEVVKVDSAIVSAAQEIAEREDAKQEVKKELEEKKLRKKTSSEQIDSSEQKTVKEAPTPAEKMTTPQEEVLTEKPLSRQVLQGSLSQQTAQSGGEAQKQLVQASPLPGEKLLLTGIGASESTFRGTVVIVSNVDDLNAQSKSLSKETVLVVPEHFPEIDAVTMKVGAVIVDTGGITSDLATVSRERGMPCIMGSHVASKMLNPGESVLVDGTIGAVYGVRDFHTQPAKEEPPAQKSPPKPVQTQKSAGESAEKSAQKSVEKSAEKKSPAEMPVPKPVQKPSEKSVEESVQKSSSAKSVASKKEVVPPPPTFVQTATKIFCDLSDSYLRGDGWKEAIPYADGVTVLEMEDLYKQDGKHPESYTGKEKTANYIKSLAGKISQLCEDVHGKPLMVSIGNMPVSEYKKLNGGEKLEKISTDSIPDNALGLLRLTQHPKELQLFFDTIKRVRNVEGWRTVSVAVSYPVSPTHLAEFKKMLSAGGLRRSSTFNIYLTIDTPSEAMIVEDFIKTGIDGIIVHVGNLTKHMMASGPNDESVLKTLENIRKNSTEVTSILLLPKESQNALQKSVRLGFSGVAVPSPDVQAVRDVIAGLEHDAIMKG